MYVHIHTYIQTYRRSKEPGTSRVWPIILMHEGSCCISRVLPSRSRCWLQQTRSSQMTHSDPSCSRRSLMSCVQGNDHEYDTRTCGTALNVRCIICVFKMGRSILHLWKGSYFTLSKWSLPFNVTVKCKVARQSNLRESLIWLDLHIYLRPTGQFAIIQSVRDCDSDWDSGCDCSAPSPIIICCDSACKSPTQIPLISMGIRRMLPASHKKKSFGILHDSDCTTDKMSLDHS